ncbi:flavin reductase [Afipia sp. P52-10]|uniref:flavin reductase family protein n=1 Tax=Afipia sp. P52-10 TaxID=1429916 RepID=UPI0003DF3123|nr:flavin reductase family protein [Afipia sp. P52-10]ETR77550.1 flavin reductase [Afipia sp. P52-10]
MEIDAATLNRATAYKLMTGAIVPRPVAWVTTQSAEGVVNAAPYSAYTLISPDPPLLVFHSSRRNGDKDSARNIRATGEFVVNVANEDLLVQMHQCSASLPPDVSEPATFGIALSPSTTVTPPRIKASPICFECKQVQMFDVGNEPHTVIIGQIVHFYVADRLYRDGRIDQAQLRPVARVGGPTYARLGELIHLPPPQGYRSD